MPVIVCKKYYKKRFTKNKSNVSLFTLFEAYFLSFSGRFFSFLQALYNEFSMKSNYSGLEIDPEHQQKVNSGKDRYKNFEHGLLCFMPEVLHP